MRTEAVQLFFGAVVLGGLACSSGGRPSETSGRTDLTFAGEQLKGTGILRASPDGAVLRLSATTSPGTRIGSLTFDAELEPGAWENDLFLIQQLSTRIEDQVIGVGVANVLKTSTTTGVVEQDGGAQVPDPHANEPPPPPPPSSTNFERESPVEDVVQLRIVGVKLQFTKARAVAGEILWVDNRGLDYSQSGDLPPPQRMALTGKVNVVCAQPSPEGTVTYWDGPFDSWARCLSALGGFD